MLLLCFRNFSCNRFEIYPQWKLLAAHLLSGNESSEFFPHLFILLLPQAKFAVWLTSYLLAAQLRQNWHAYDQHGTIFKTLLWPYHLDSCSFCGLILDVSPQSAYCGGPGFSPNYLHLPTYLFISTFRVSYLLGCKLTQDAKKARFSEFAVPYFSSSHSHSHSHSHSQSQF